MALTTLAIEESIHIAAAPEIVWRFLAEPRSWQHWWTGCRGAETQDRKTLHDGSQLLLALHLGWMTWKFTVRIGAMTANRSLAWAGKGGGVGSRHAFYLDAKPNGTFVRQQATFSGPGVSVLPAAAPRRRIPADVPPESSGTEARCRARELVRKPGQRKPRRSSRAKSFQVASSKRQTMTRWSLVPPCR